MHVVRVPEGFVPFTTRWGGPARLRLPAVRRQGSGALVIPDVGAQLGAGVSTLSRVIGTSSNLPRRLTLMVI